MSGAIDLARIPLGFASPVFDSQRVFRAALRALSRPGSVQEIDVAPDAPTILHSAAGALLLALLDQDTRLWLSPSLPETVALYLRFHTGCTICIAPQHADFAIVADPLELPSLRDFAFGTEDYPDRSTTVLLQVQSFGEGIGWDLAGPGIDGRIEIRIAGIDEFFVAAWNAQRAALPCGVDFFFIAGSSLVGLPRTTRIGA